MSEINKKFRQKNIIKIEETWGFDQIKWNIFQMFQHHLALRGENKTAVKEKFRSSEQQLWR